ncbi:MAG: dihydrolipoamide acetyltransferase family protein [Nanoarchaeota archaeon]|nr:dihydrolipoamide acetyltransferase family protein [Nanoarchaeota archaeon]
MAYEFKFPDVGEGITEGEIVKWKVKVGDNIKEDDTLADIETDKAVVQIPSPVDGIVLKLNFNEGETVHVGDVLVVIGQKGEAAPEEKNLEDRVVKRDAETVKKGSVGVVGDLEDADYVDKNIKEAREEIRPAVNKREESSVEKADKIVGKVLAMPKVRKFAEEIGADLTKLNATGKHGQITESDVRVSSGSGTSEVEKNVKHVRKYDNYGYVERAPLKGIRKTIARNMTRSATEIPHVSHIDRADLTKLSEIRSVEKEKAEKEGIKLTYLPFIVKAIVAALKEHPTLNSVLESDEFGNEEIVMRKYYNIGIAVDTSDGLMVPVIKSADKKSILDIAKEIADLADKARNKNINLSDMKGGTFTITNYGSLGGMFGTPIINYPEAAIVGLGRMKDEATVIDGKVAIRKIIYLTLSFDHRILDGAEAAKFMNKVIDYLEDPDLLLVEM